MIAKTIQMAANTAYVVPLGAEYSSLRFRAVKACWVQPVAAASAPASGLAAGEIPAANGEQKDVIELADASDVKVGYDLPAGYSTQICGTLPAGNRYTHVRIRSGAAGNLTIIAQ